jgi:hypothetical protein
VETATAAVETATATVETATATVETATAAVESTTAMELTPAAESVTAPESAAIVSTTAAEIAEPVTTTESAVIAAAEITVAGSIVSAVEAAEPRTCADKSAVIEVFGTVVAVRRASVRIISVVAVGAVGRGTDVSRGRNIGRTNSNADAKSNLGVGGRACENYEKPEQTEISHRQASFTYTHLDAIDVPKTGEGAVIQVAYASIAYIHQLGGGAGGRSLGMAEIHRPAAFQPIHAARRWRAGLRAGLGRSQAWEQEFMIWK